MHQPHGATQGQSVDIERAAHEFAHLRRRMFEFLAHHTGQPVERIALDADRDFILRGEAAVDYGLVDSVLSRAVSSWLPGTPSSPPRPDQSGPVPATKIEQ